MPFAFAPLASHFSSAPSSSSSSSSLSLSRPPTATSGGGGTFGSLLAVARRWKSGGGHRRGGARAQPVRKTPKLKRKPVGKYKLKSHKGALKRFYQTGDGTFVHKAAGKKHLQAGTSRRRQTLRKKAHRPVLARGIERKLRRLMPYGTTLQPPRRHTVSVLWERPDNWTELVAAAAKAVADSERAGSGGRGGAKKAKQAK